MHVQVQIYFAHFFPLQPAHLCVAIVTPPTSQQTIVLGPVRVHSMFCSQVLCAGLVRFVITLFFILHIVWIVQPVELRPRVFFVFGFLRKE